MVDIAETPQAPPQEEGGMYSKTYRNGALALLVAIYTVNFLDRQIITTIGEAIRLDLGLNDTQMGALGGIFFAFVYTVLGLPIARWADRGNRPLIMTLSLGVWSGFTVLSAFARNYAVLAVARAGVGIGEAGCSPTAHSLLADYFPKNRRATALSIYSMGISIGTLLGMAIGGIVAEHWGWRNAFLVAGLPGLFFAVLSLTVLREPRKALSEKARAAALKTPSIPMLMVFSTLEQRPTFWLFALGGAFSSMVSYAHGQFFAPLYLRNYTPELSALAGNFGMAPEPGTLPLGFLSLALGLAAGIGGAFGSWLGGYVADRWGAQNIRNYALLPIIIPFITLPTLWYAIGTSNMALSLFLLLIPNIGVGAWWGPVYGGVQGLVPSAMRALSAAVLLFVINMIGLGAGPTAFGMGIDFMTNQYLAGTGLDVAACAAATGDAAATCGAASARAILMTTYFSTAIIPVATLCFFLSRYTIAKDMDRAESLPDKPMSTGKLVAYLAGIGAIPGLFLGNASALFFENPSPIGWLYGLVIGAAVGAVAAFYFAAQGKPRAN